MMNSVARIGQALLDQADRVEQHADRDEEQHREGVAQRQRFLGRAVAELGFAHDHAGEEGAERQRHAEQLCRAEGDAERDRQHRQPEQLARAGMGDVVQDPGDDPPADDQHDGDEGGDLGQRDADDAPDAELGGQRRADRWRGCPLAAGRRARRPAPAAAPAPAPWRGLRRSASRRRCGRARSRSAAAPAARAAAPRWRRPTAPGRTPGRRPIVQPSSQASAGAERGGKARSARSRPGTAMARTDSRSFSEKCRPTPNISRMTPISASSQRQALVGDEARRVRPDQHAGEQIADQRRHPEAVGERAEDEGQPQTGDDGGDKRRVMRHRLVAAPSRESCIVG